MRKMIKERDFLEKIKNETLENTSLEFTRGVIKKSGILNNERKAKILLGRQLFYRGACALTSLILIGLIAFNFKGNNVKPNNAGINAVIITQQLTGSLKEVIINKNL